MAIKSSNFSRTELSGTDAARFVRHMKEDTPKQAAKAALERGRDILKQLKTAV